jgi:hypothetical protein
MDDNTEFTVKMTLEGWISVVGYHFLPDEVARAFKDKDYLYWVKNHSRQAFVYREIKRQIKEQL